MLQYFYGSSKGIVQLCIKIYLNLTRFKRGNNINISILPAASSGFSISNFIHDQVRLMPSYPSTSNIIIHLLIVLKFSWRQNKTKSSRADSRSKV